MELARPYSSDLSDREWSLVEPLLPAPDPKRPDAPLRYPMRRILNGIFYVLRTGCPWRYLPHEYPPWPTVYHHYRRLGDRGHWAHISLALTHKDRQRRGLDPEPTVAILDSQSAPTGPQRTPMKGYDAGKK